MLRKTVVALLALGACHSVFAEGMRQVNTGSVHNFIGVDFGSTEHNVGIDGYSDDYSSNASGLGLNIGFWLSDNVGIVVGYVDFGDTNLSKLNYVSSTYSEFHSVEAKAFLVGAVLSTPVWQRPWRFYGEIGAHKTDYTWSVKGQAGGTPYSANVVDTSTVDIWGGLGLGYSFSQQLEGKLAVDWFVLKPDLTTEAQYVYGESKADIQLTRYSLGLNYQF